MTRILGIVATLSLAYVPANAGQGDKTADTSDARKILRKSAEAIKKLETVGYDAEYRTTAWVRQFVGDVTGKAVVGKESKWKIDRFSCDVKLQKPESEETLDLAAGCDGNVYFLIDKAAKTAYEDMDPMVLGSNGRDVQRVVLGEFGSPEPFKEELELETIALAGTETVAGEDCYHLRYENPSPPAADVDLFIAKSDFLPRKLVRTYANRQDPEGEKGTTELTLSNLKVSPKFEHNPFKLAVPEGFKKTTDFAP